MARHRPDAITCLVLLSMTLSALQTALQSTLTWIEQLGPAGGGAFIVIYVVATVAMMPGGLLTLAAGVLFGLGWGSLFTFVGAMLGSSLAFALGRYRLRGWVAQRWLKEGSRLAAFDRAIARDGWRIVLLVRLSPLFPFNAVNYIFGLTCISWRDYVLASLGTLPGTFLYVYLGTTFKSVAELLSGTQRSKTPLEWGLFVFGLVATVVLTVYLTRLAGRALAEAEILPSPGKPPGKP